MRQGVRGHWGLPAGFAAAALVLILAPSRCPAQQTRPVATAAAASRPATTAANGFVELNLPPDVELRVVVDYIAKRLGMNVIYDQRVDGQKLTLTTPGRVPTASLPALLEGVLRSKGFALADAGVPGWKRIVSVGDPAGDVQVAAVPAKHADPGELAQEVRRLLAARAKAEGATAPADVSADPRSKQVIVVGPAAQVTAAREIVALLDVPVTREETPVRFYKLANTTAADVLDTIRPWTGKNGGRRPARSARPRTGPSSSRPSRRARPARRSGRCWADPGRPDRTAAGGGVAFGGGNDRAGGSSGIGLGTGTGTGSYGNTAGLGSGGLGTGGTSFGSGADAARQGIGSGVGAAGGSLRTPGRPGGGRRRVRAAGIGRARSRSGPGSPRWRPTRTRTRSLWSARRPPSDCTRT
jgi:type II secretory pathway component GspD/PulD (secretin)